MDFIGDQRAGLVYITTVPSITLEPHLTVKCLFSRNFDLVVQALEILHVTSTTLQNFFGALSSMSSLITKVRSFPYNSPMDKLAGVILRRQNPFKNPSLEKAFRLKFPAPLHGMELGNSSVVMKFGRFQLKFISALLQRSERILAQIQGDSQSLV